jgi:hypothetical protein
VLASGDDPPDPPRAIRSDQPPAGRRDWPSSAGNPGPRIRHIAAVGAARDPGYSSGTSVGVARVSVSFLKKAGAETRM